MNRDGVWRRIERGMEIAGWLLVILAVIDREWDRATFALVMTIYMTEIHRRSPVRMSKP